MNKIILIDDQYATGWEAVFQCMIKKTYGDLVQFEALHDISNDAIRACYTDNPDALFIQDNDLGPYVTKGIDWLDEFGQKRAIIIHTADHYLAFRSAKAGAYMFMLKDNPEHSMTNEEMQTMVIEFHNHIIRHFKLIPEFIWLVYMQLGIKS